MSFPSLGTQEFCSSQGEQNDEELSKNQLNIYVSRAELKQDMPAFDSNLYVSVISSNFSLRTRTAKYSFSPQFNEKLCIPVDRNQSKIIKLEFCLENSRFGDKKIDAKKLKLSELIKYQNNWQMIHFYSNQSSYSGNIVVKFKLKKVKNPSTTQSIFKHINLKPVLTQYILWVEIIEIAGFGINESLRVILELGFTSLISSPAKPQNQRWVWGKYGYLKEFISTQSEDPKQVPDLIVKVISESSKKITGTLRKSSFDLIQQGSKSIIPTWEELKLEDDSLTYPAFILMRLNLAALGHLEHFRPERLFYISSLFEVRAVVFQGQNLGLSETKGLLDPFITISINGVSKKTQVIHQSLNPHWNEVLVWKIDLFLDNSLKNLVQVDLWDWNNLPGKNNKKASTIVNFSTISQEKPAKPNWLSIRTKLQLFNPRVLMSFSIYKLENAKQIIHPLSIKDLMSSVSCWLNVLIIGPRNSRVFETWIEKIFIRLTAGESKPVETKLLEIKKNERNWNFMETLKVQLKIPIDPIYSPAVSFYLIGKNNLREELVGSACFSLENFLPWVAKKDESSDDEAIDRTQILDNELKYKTANKAHEKFREKWPGYKKKVISRQEISTTFENHFGSSLPFQTIELKRLENTKDLIVSSLLRLRISLFKESDLNTLDNLSESFKKVSILYARLNIFTLKFLPTTSKHYFIRIQSSKSSNQSIESDLIKGPTAQLNTSYTLKLLLPSENFLSLEVQPENPSSNAHFSWLFDIEERWFNQKFQKIKSSDPASVPIETIQLKNFDNSDSNVQLVTCFELLTEEELRRNPSQVFKGNIKNSFELRLVVWKVKEMSLTSKDLIVRAVFNDGREVVEETDVHFGALDQAEFNWRIKFLIDLPAEEPFVKLELVDMKEKTTIAKCDLDLQDFFDDCLNSDEPVVLEKQWISFHDFEGNTAGFVLLEVKIVSLDQIHDFPAGGGRESPNIEPFLAIPKTGRNHDHIQNEIIYLKEEKEKKKSKYKKCIALLVCIIFIAAIPISLSVIL